MLCHLDFFALFGSRVQPSAFVRTPAFAVKFLAGAGAGHAKSGLANEGGKTCTFRGVAGDPQWGSDNGKVRFGWAAPMLTPAIQESRPKAVVAEDPRANASDIGSSANLKSQFSVRSSHPFTYIKSSASGARYPFAVLSEYAVSDLREPNFSMPLGIAFGGRRSIRDFRPDKLDRATIDRLLRAAVWAPKALQQEPCAFVIVQDRAVLKRISDRAKASFLDDIQRAHVQRFGHGTNIFAEPDFNIFYNAGTLILLCGVTNAPFVLADCWLAAENILLAAYAAGLGSCLIGAAVPTLNEEQSKRELSIPATYSVVAPIVVGVPNGEGPPRAPKEEPLVLHWQ